MSPTSNKPSIQAAFVIYWPCTYLWWSTLSKFSPTTVTGEANWKMSSALPSSCKLLLFACFWSLFIIFPVLWPKGKIKIFYWLISKYLMFSPYSLHSIERSLAIRPINLELLCIPCMMTEFESNRSIVIINDKGAYRHVVECVLYTVV